MDFSKLVDMREEPNITGSFACQHEDCTETATAGFLDEGTGIVTYTCSRKHTSEFKLY